MDEQAGTGQDRELTPGEARELHARGGTVVWAVMPGKPPGSSQDRVMARPHTMAADGGRFLPGRLAAGTLEELRALLPPGLARCEAWPGVTPPGWVEWWG